MVMTKDKTKIVFELDKETGIPLLFVNILIVV